MPGAGCAEGTRYRYRRMKERLAVIVTAFEARKPGNVVAVEIRISFAFVVLFVFTHYIPP